MRIKPTVSPQARLLTVGSVCFIALLIGLHAMSSPTPPAWVPREVRQSWATPVMALICVLLGITLIRTLVTMISERASTYLGVARSRSVRSVLNIVLYVVLALTVASQTQIDLTGIALSGAVTGVIIGIAAQASIANVVAGLVILFSRPFRAGQYVTVRAAAFAGSEYSGEVGDITLFYTTLFAGTQEIRVPNSSMVTSVVTLRPQMLDVYLPVILPPARWEKLSTVELSRQLAEVLPARRYVNAVVERMEGGTMQVGVHASVANDEERSVLENALLKIFAPAHSMDVTGPDHDFA